MTYSDAIAFFDDHFEVLKNMIVDETLSTNDVDGETCRSIERGLRLLAQAGHTYAAGLYCLVAATAGLEDHFPLETAQELYFKDGVQNAYYELAADIFDGRFPAGVRGAPAVWFFNSIPEKD